MNAVKSLWTSARSSNSASETLSEQGILAARQKMVRRDVIQAIAEMVRTSPKYPVLVNEGIIALTLLGSERMGAELVSLSLLAEPTKASIKEDDDEEMASDNEAQARVHDDDALPLTAPLDLVSSLAPTRLRARHGQPSAGEERRTHAASIRLQCLCTCSQPLPRNAGAKQHGAVGQDAVTHVACQDSTCSATVERSGPDRGACCCGRCSAGCFLGSYGLTAAPVSIQARIPVSF